MSDREYEQNLRDDEYMSLSLDIHDMCRRIDDLLQKGTPERIGPHRLELARGIYNRMAAVTEFIDDYRKP